MPKSTTTVPKIPWPTKDAMTQIYELHLWGGKDFDFYSGEGSHNPKIVMPYLKSVTKFLKSGAEKFILCDLGCGDFNIGKELAPYCTSYIGIDIVKNLITRNKTLFKMNNVEFLCLDISKEELPKGDGILLRQVFQHLSNSEILSVLPKLNAYKFIIFTEHLPIGDFIPNLDIISGQGIRLKQNSGVDLTKDPFKLKFRKNTVLNEVILDDNKGRITTILYELN